MTNDTVLKYEKYIYGIAKKFDYYQNKEDLIQVGFLGLIMALKNYKSNMGVKFTTYAYKYIFGEMNKLVREDKSIKISRNIIKLKSQIEKTKSILSQKYGRNPTNNELSQFLEIPIQDIEEILKTDYSVISIDKSINEDNINLYDIIPSNNMDLDTLVMLKNSLLELDKKDRDILNYSMNMTEREIGEIYDMNQVKVSRTLKKIKQSIRQNMQ